MKRSLLAIVLVACGPGRAPLPPPASARSWVPVLPAPPERDAEHAPPAAPTVATFELPNGLSVQIVERPGVPVVYTALAGRGGRSGRVPPELDAILEHALGGSSSLSERDDPNAAARVGERGTVLVSRTVPSGVGRALDRYAALFEGRGMQYDEITRSRTSLLEQVALERRLRARSREAPPTEDLFARLYGEDHPRVRRMRMRSRAIERTDVESVHRHLARVLTPSESLLVVVGDVDAAALEAQIRERFAFPSAGGQPRAQLPPTPSFPQPGATRLRIHPTRDQPNAIIRLVERGPAIHHADYPAFRLFARLAGGMFSSRLNLSLRESRGDTYGVMTSVYDRSDHSILDIMIVVPVAAAGHAASAIVEELRRLSTRTEIDDEELRIARSVELAELDASLETSAGLGRALVEAFLAHEPPTAIVESYARVAALDAASVASVAARWVRPDGAPMVIIGDGLWLFTHPVRVPGGVTIVGM